MSNVLIHFLYAVRGDMHIQKHVKCSESDTLNKHQVQRNPRLKLLTGQKWRVSPTIPISQTLTNVSRSPPLICVKWTRPVLYDLSRGTDVLLPLFCRLNMAALLRSIRLLKLSPSPLLRVKRNSHGPPINRLYSRAVGGRGVEACPRQIALRCAGASR